MKLVRWFKSHVKGVVTACVVGGAALSGQIAHAQTTVLPTATEIKQTMVDTVQPYILPVVGAGMGFAILFWGIRYIKRHALGR